MARNRIGRSATQVKSYNLRSHKATLLPEPDYEAELTVRAPVRQCAEVLLELVFLTAGEAEPDELARTDLAASQHAFLFKSFKLINNADGLGCFFTNSEILFARRKLKGRNALRAIYTWDKGLRHVNRIRDHDVIATHVNKRIVEGNNAWLDVGVAANKESRHTK